MSNTLESRVLETLRAQQYAWNAGDLDTFLASFVPDERTCFVGPNGIERGYAKLVGRYRARYNNPSEMGRLELSALCVQPIADAAASVTGEFALSTAAHVHRGVFSLLLVEHEQRMKIVLDHTTPRLT